MKKFKFWSRFLGAFGIFCILLANSSWIAAAQFGEELWSVPVNLSESGGASDPLIVAYPEGVFHVIWQDAFLGTMYRTGDGIEWEEPVGIITPFDGYRAQVAVDTEGTVHALWLDDSGTLLYSRIRADRLASYGAWTSRSPVAYSVLAFSVTFSDSGRGHLAIVSGQTEGDLLPGIYYSKLELRRTYWSSPQLIYQSPYFRSLTAENAHAQVSANFEEEAEQVHLAWDNFALKRVFYTSSEDGGDTWKEPEEVDKPEEGAVDAGPSKLFVSAANDDVLLVWQKSSSETDCARYFKWSTDNGLTWSSPQLLQEGTPGCPTNYQILNGTNGHTILVSRLQDIFFLQAWNGETWSDPQLQTVLGSFIDPDTQRRIQFGCQQALITHNDDLAVVGCDTGEGQDIWWMRRSLNDVEDWYSKELVWSSLFDLASSDIRLTQTSILADTEGRIHVVWSQAKDERGGTDIFYSRRENEQWMPPVVIHTFPFDQTLNPAIGLDPRGRVFVVWSGGMAGEIYFTSANLDRAIVATTWSDPESLPRTRASGASPYILVDRSGTIIVAYSVPLNEGRGIYLISSDDGGESWSDPVRVFDGVAAGWEMVGDPRIDKRENGDIHVLWPRYSLPPDAATTGLYYTQSSDGVTWMEPGVVVNKPVAWSDISGIGERTVQRVWQEVNSGRITLWHEQSLDGGQTWTRTSPVSIFGDSAGIPSMISDRSGRLHLLQVVGRTVGNFTLQHWVWDGETWIAEQRADIQRSNVSRVDSLVATVSQEGLLVSLLNATTEDPISQVEQYHLFVTERSLELPSDIPQAMAGAEPTPTLVPTETPEPESIVTQAVVSGAAEGGIETDPPPVGDYLQRSLIGPLAAGIVVLIFAFIGLRLHRRS